eukprot:CAMPEP_0194126796 /NCGR_PEP_ID=MMETSP0150-20130528/60174_1 /TAXON_ID=122233 /ORGANISM="Chaetoceros debilis, Strain MM31A-1" /LENGTH=377 /DNA_ID=CAMNT_0038820677 /DNA_START=852 /DNA_END=1985 /DNA_ORIENTATION=-
MNEITSKIKLSEKPTKTELERRETMPSSSQAHPTRKRSFSNEADNKVIRKNNTLSVISDTTSPNPLSFEENLALLKSFKRRFGHTRVTSKSGYRDLHNFVTSMRKSYMNSDSAGLTKNNRRRLFDDRFQQLQDVGFEWTVPTRISFEERVLELEAFKKKFGHCDVRQSYSGYKVLSRWCACIRSSYKKFQLKGGSERLTKERCKRLNDIGFKWTARDAFEEKVQELEDFKNKFGHCDVRKNTYPDFKSLAWWCTNIRASYKEFQVKGKSRVLTKDIIKRLNDIGFLWSIFTVSRAFEERLLELQDFKSKFGHCDVRKSYPGYESLSTWCTRTRRSCKEIQPKGKPQRFAKEERIKRLNDIGFQWEVSTKKTFEKRVL